MQRNTDSRKPGGAQKPEERKKNQTPKTLRTRPEGRPKNQTPKGESAIERVPSPIHAPNELEEEIKEKVEIVSPESVNQQVQELKRQMMQELEVVNGKLAEEMEKSKKMENKVVSLQNELESVRYSRSSRENSERGSHDRYCVEPDKEYSPGIWRYAAPILSQTNLLKLGQREKVALSPSMGEEVEELEERAEGSPEMPHNKRSMRKSQSEMREFRQPKRIYNSPSGSSPNFSAHSEGSNSSSNSSTIGDFENETIYMPKTPRKNKEPRKRGKMRYHNDDNLFHRMSVENLVQGNTSDKYMDIKWSDL